MIQMSWEQILAVLVKKDLRIAELEQELKAATESQITKSSEWAAEKAALEMNRKQAVVAGKLSPGEGFAQMRCRICGVEIKDRDDYKSNFTHTITEFAHTKCLIDTPVASDESIIAQIKARNERFLADMDAAADKLSIEAAADSPANIVVEAGADVKPPF